MPKRKRTKTSATLPVDHIVPELQHLACPIGELALDPDNANTHDRKNLNAIKQSLQTFGQRFPIVAHRKTKTVLAGNGRIMAAHELGWPTIATLLVDDDEQAAIAFAVADNRTAELSQWDADQLQVNLQALGADLETFTENPYVIGFDAGDLTTYLPDLEHEEKPPQAKKSQSANGKTAGGAVTYSITIMCNSEREQTRLLRRLQEEGWDCTVSTG